MLDKVGLLTRTPRGDFNNREIAVFHYILQVSVCAGMQSYNNFSMINT